FELACNAVLLDDIEPFTIVCVLWENELRLLEFVWDGSKKHLKLLPLQPTIWSSSTLYTDKMKSLRQDWFREWFIGKGLNPENVLEFHKKGGLGFPEVDVFMRREHVGTVSITQVKETDNKIEMKYFPFPLN
ncbi:MAG: NRDE family protein, partial [Lutimonas sp.]